MVMSKYTVVRVSRPQRTQNSENSKGCCNYLKKPYCMGWNRPGQSAQNLDVSFSHWLRIQGRRCTRDISECTIWTSYVSGWNVYLVSGSWRVPEKCYRHDRSQVGELVDTRKVNTPLNPDYHPEVDTSLLDDDRVNNYYQSMIGILQWASEVGRIDI